MILDLDGTLTGKNVMTYITPYYHHFDNLIADNSCVMPKDLYDDSVLCSVILRSFYFRNYLPLGFIEFSPMKILDLINAEGEAEYGDS